MAFTFDAIFAADPNNAANVASNAAITIFDPNDPGKAPITITDPTDSPISNPITVNKNGFGPAFKHATLDRVGWSGGGFEGFFTSYEGIKNVALEAQAAAEAAGATAAAEAAAGVAPVVAEAEQAAADAAAAQAAAAASATAAANSAALVNAPADSAIAAAINGADTQTKAALSATYASAAVPGDITGTHTKGYDRRRCVYNFAPAKLRRMRAKLGAALAGTGLCVIGNVGDSITAGEGGDKVTQSWPVQARNLLEKRGVTVSGTGIVPATQWSSGLDARWTYGAGWSDFMPGIRNHLRQCSTNGSTATFASDKAGTIAQLVFSNAGGPFTVTVDGASPGTATLSAGGTYSAGTVTPAGGGTLNLLSFTGLSDTTHTIVVTKGTGGTVYIGGAGVRKSAGLVFHAGGIGGSTTTDWASAQTYGPSAQIALMSPNIVTVALLTNDARAGSQQVTPAVYKTQTQAIIDKFKATADVVLIAGPPASGVDLTAYRIALYELADTNDLPLIDINDRWGTWPEANGNGLMADIYHPYAAGYGDYAQAVIDAIF